MTDQQLLERAAKAAGLKYMVDRRGFFRVETQPDTYRMWSPLSDPGEALRLAVRLKIEVRNFNGSSHAGRTDKFWHTENWFPDGDPLAATCRAITRAAAAMADQEWM